ncbi:MAG TPA: DUF4276 family protein [Cellvibrionaceae bacterium]|nr:DUF4276 family protein [Cellvibrionaceae bacterium]HMW48769.1 DUF4276 family protein [Cellvibrionaceae bacterium]HMW72977.1 DUF4276 family protein [Cellvibrionaceae bacterium]HMY39383.1 DUF4276 family protein [Marinagarivorans sp.]HNG59728.1 DUF4276 family protein [Cellvibrionaceae bacterium]
MDKQVEVLAIVEGKTEQIFIEAILAPYFAEKGIYLRATQVSKPGQKGGDVKFSRTIKDIGNHLKQRSDTYVATFVDYYGIKEWPGLDKVPPQASPTKIAEVVNLETCLLVATTYPELQTHTRYIPYLAVHEFEALLFSCSETLAAKLSIKLEQVEKVLSDCGEPEAINNSPITAPSKRLDAWVIGGKFKKTSAGISIASSIGISKMREKCPVFNTWLLALERLVAVNEP